MKKQNLIALVGVIALMANLVLPNLAFGQSTQEGQYGTAEITGCTGSPSFDATLTNIDSFDFLVGGTQAIAQGTGVQNTFSNENVTDEAIPEVSRKIVVYDPRDPRDPTCTTNGVTVDIRAYDEDTDGKMFENTDGSQYIPTSDGEGNYLWVGTSNVWVPTDFTAGTTSQVFYGSANEYLTYCDSANFSCDGLITAANDIGEVFNNYSTFTGLTGNNLTFFGTGEEENPVTVMDADGTAAFIGYAGLNAHFAQQIPALQASGIYKVNIVVTLNQA